MLTNLDLVTFTEEILIEKLHFCPVQFERSKSTKVLLFITIKHMDIPSPKEHP